MDFEVAEAIRSAVRERAAHGIYGYTLLPESYYRAVIAWMAGRFGWKIRKKWIVFTPGVVPALNFAVQAYTEPGDKVVIQPPVYYPFSLAVRNNGRIVVDNPLGLESGRWVMDLDNLRRSIDRRVKLLILCSPHNPVGRVWTPRELRELAAVCRDHDLLIVSDEIHGDLTHPDHPHTPLAALLPDMADRIVTCTSPSKTFNIAGLQTANTIIPDPGLRKRFQETVHAAGIELANAFGVAAAEAAYTHGRPWLASLIDYLWDNFAFVRDFAARKMPELGVHDLEGTYLVWLDGRAVERDDRRLKDVLLKRGVWLDEGSKFGTGGGGYLRMNIACPRPLLERALDRMQRGLREHRA
jgi:cystathionine beta-lyase